MVKVQQGKDLTPLPSFLYIGCFFNQNIQHEKFTIIYLFGSISHILLKPLDRPFKKETMEQDVIELKKKLSKEELEVLGSYIAVKMIGKDQMIGKTYGDLLREAKDLKAKTEAKQAEEKALAEKVKANEMERAERLGKSITVSLFEKGFGKYNYREYITYKFVFENKTDKEIKAFKGVMVFNDLFDKKINELAITYDDGVPAKATKQWSAQSEYNQFRSEDTTFRNKKIGDLKITWIPEKIIFTDGSTLG